MMRSDDDAHQVGFQMMEAIKMCFSSASTSSIEELQIHVNSWMALSVHQGSMRDAIELITDANGKTLLHVATQAGNIPVVEWLLASNGLLSQRQTLDKPAHYPHRYIMSITDSEKRQSILQSLMEHYADGVRSGLVHVAAMEGAVDVLKQIVTFFKSQDKPVMDIFCEELEDLGRPVQCAVLGAKANETLDVLIEHVPISELILGSPKSGIPAALCLAAVQDGNPFKHMMQHLGLTDDDVIRCLDPQGFNIAHLVAESNAFENLTMLKDNFPVAYKNMVTDNTAASVSTVDNSNNTSKAEEQEDSDEEKRVRNRLRSVYDQEQAENADQDTLDHLNHLKQKGFDAVSAHQWDVAVPIYREALSKCPKVPATQVYRSQVYANLSLCHLKMEVDGPAAKEAARHAIALQPSWWKAYLRLAMAFAAEGDYTEACQQVYQGMLKLGEHAENEKKMMKSFLDSYVAQARQQLTASSI